MREESHLDEMRTAIRGDFERLAERRGEQDLMRVADEASPEPSVEAHEPELAVEVPAAEVEAEPEPEARPELDAEPEPEAQAEPAQRSWLARLFSPP
jgi:pilus assembly protein FimV